MFTFVPNHIQTAVDSVTSNPVFRRSVLLDKALSIKTGSEPAHASKQASKRTHTQAVAGLLPFRFISHGRVAWRAVKFTGGPQDRVRRERGHLHVCGALRCFVRGQRTAAKRKPRCLSQGNDPDSNPRHFVIRCTGRQQYTEEVHFVMTVECNCVSQRNYLEIDKRCGW
jgi:hypothetical protein